MRLPRNIMMRQRLARIGTLPSQAALIAAEPNIVTNVQSRQQRVIRTPISKTVCVKICLKTCLL